MAFLCRCDRCLQTECCTYLILVTTDQHVTTCFFACRSCIRRVWLVTSLTDGMTERSPVTHDSNAWFRMALRVCGAMDIRPAFIFSWWASNEWKILIIKPFCYPVLRKSTSRVVREWLCGTCDWTESVKCSVCGESEGYGIYRASLQTPFAFACCRCINVIMVLASPFVQEFGNVPFDYVLIFNGDEAAVMYEYGSLDLLYWLIMNF